MKIVRISSSGENVTVMIKAVKRGEAHLSAWSSQNAIVGAPDVEAIVQLVVN